MDINIKKTTMENKQIILDFDSNAEANKFIIFILQQNTTKRKWK